MSNIVEEYNRLVQERNKIGSEISRLSGSAEELQKNLKEKYSDLQEKFGISTIEEALELKQRLEKEIDECMVEAKQVLGGGVKVEEEGTFDVGFE